MGGGPQKVDMSSIEKEYRTLIEKLGRALDGPTSQRQLEKINNLEQKLIALKFKFIKVIDQDQDSLRFAIGKKFSFCPVSP